MKRITIDGIEGIWTPLSEATTKGESAINQAIAFIARWEGFKPHAYRDPVGVWTIGYGHTAGVKKGDSITYEEAGVLLREEVEQFMVNVTKQTSAPINQNQLVALTSFAYNLGMGAYSNSTLLRKLNQGKNEEAADEFARWIYAGGRQLKGLIHRRAAERDLFLTEV